MNSTLKTSLAALCAVAGGLLSSCVTPARTVVVAPAPPPVVRYYPAPRPYYAPRPPRYYRPAPYRRGYYPPAPRPGRVIIVR
ncbi:hypothetical protein [Hymenobacter latericus]|uniref:hypothetical protein n=1 Tax=Hymenobacter sp. YIM 151858-1 TaxID=2987688 RepID=UPI0022264BD8|nr:hypothetical protein [Hymenobacter sp. YIM 151858-1]UYZ57573.1 hypothetical protein OIS50_10875 [Hymenobacter sp. YIM 151858-1]